MAHSCVSATFAHARRAALFVILSTAASSSNAAVHFWEITEVYSNADGSVQFIEMFDPLNGENYVAGSQLIFDADGVITTYTFPDNIPLNIPTGQNNLLIATQGFEAVAGVTPDFERAAGMFFNPNFSDLTVTFTGSFSELVALDDVFPTDGVHSWTQNGSAINSPRNIHDQEGFVDLSGPDPTGDYNGNGRVDAADYVVWRKTLNQSVDPHGSGADGDGDGTVDDGDYVYWRERFGDVVDGAGTNVGGAIPEPTTGTFALAVYLACGLLGGRRRR
jgi:hypothetical protein